MRVKISVESKSKDRIESVGNQIKLSQFFEVSDNIEKRIYFQNPENFHPIGIHVAYYEWDDNAD